MHRRTAVLAGLLSALILLAAPVAEAGGSLPLGGVTQLSGGFFHVCARTTVGQVACWGNNISGELGTGDQVQRNVAAFVHDTDGTGLLEDVSQVAAGQDHSCARLTNGQARCWGENGRGELGHGAGPDSPLPVAVRNAAGTGPLHDVTALTGGLAHTCALLASHQVRCWGRNVNGQLGNGTRRSASRPVVVVGPTGSAPLTGVVQIDAGQTHTCARLSSGLVVCWGVNADGQLGNGPLTRSSRPVVVRAVTGPGPLTGVAQIAAGGRHTCARLAGGQLRCWGWNGSGQLGVGGADSNPHARPLVVDNATGSGPLTGVAEVAVGFRHTCARLGNGQGRCWGYNDTYALGTGNLDATRRPAVVRNETGTAALADLSSITAGAGYGCAAIAGDTVRCWGGDGFGEDGDGSDAGSPLPVIVITE